MIVTNKPDKIQLYNSEIREWEAKVPQGKRDFKQNSKMIQEEVGRLRKKE